MREHSKDIIKKESMEARNKERKYKGNEKKEKKQNLKWKRTKS